MSLPLGPMASSIINHDAVRGKTFLPGQIFGFGGSALRANSLGHLEQIESYAPGHQVRFGSLNYTADIRGDLIFNGFEPRPSAPHCHDGHDLALPNLGKTLCPSSPVTIRLDAQFGTPYPRSAGFDTDIGAFIESSSVSLPLGPMASSIINHDAVRGKTFLPGQIFGFGGSALRANSLGHLEQIESYAPGHQVRFGSLNYTADIRGDLIFNGFEPRPSAPHCHDGHDLALPPDSA